MSNPRRKIFCLGGLASIFFLAASANGGTYLDSAHGGYNTAGKGVKRLSGYASGNCAHCHEQHASIGGVEPAPAGGAPSPYGLFDDVVNSNALCNFCHDTSQSNGADNIASQISKTYSHSPTSSISMVLCTDCHNSHVAQTTTHSAAVDGNQVGTTAAAKSGPLLEVAGVSASWTPPGAPAGGTETLNNATLSGKNPITAEYELCFKCHGGQVGGLTNLSGQFNPDNFAHHPVTGTGLWKNSLIQSYYAKILKAPWNANPNARMYCSDCHGSETTGDPAGPHGASNPYMLKAVGPGSSYDNLCLLCHVDQYKNGGLKILDATYTGYAHGDGDAAHQYQGEAAGQNKLGCMACHGGPDNALYSKVGGVTSNGGRLSAIHGENFNWKNPDGSTSPADKFLLGGYLLGVNTTTKTCWAGMSGSIDGCHLVTISKTW